MSADIIAPVEPLAAITTNPEAVNLELANAVETVAQSKTVEQLLQELQVALGSTQIFPAADKTQAFEHISFDFNLKDGTVTASTEAADESGKPLYSVVYSQPVKSEQKAEQESTTASSETNAEIMIEPIVESVEVTPPTATTEIREKPAVYDSRVLTIEEQRDIALKVCFFFISVVFGSFGLLYVYHRMQQQTKGLPADKSTL